MSFNNNTKDETTTTVVVVTRVWCECKNNEEMCSIELHFWTVRLSDCRLLFDTKKKQFF